MLKTIAIVTLVVRSLATVEPAYEEHLHYTPVQRGQVSRELARTWDTPAMAGRKFVLLRPESGEEVYLRFIQAASGTPDVAPFATSGWNATEILVTDPDALARDLDGTAFRVIGKPKNLTPAENAPRAMQVIGPANEPLYMTRFIKGASGLDLGQARTPVDRVFITVVGGPDLDALRAFYGQVLGLPLTEFGQWQIGVLADAYRLPPDTRFALAGAALPSSFMVELDDYPDTVRPRRRARGALPGGWAMVTFTAERLDSLKVSWRSKPRAIKAFPYGGRVTGVTVGPAGEWIEVIEIPAVGGTGGM
jgi:catechol 2,3-dioxygenase-like lactoylglutathione lyase family enzyme